MEIYPAIESLLFVAGEKGLSLSELSQLTGASNKEVTYSLLYLAEKYRHNPETALALIKTGERFELVTKEEFEPLIKQYAVSPFAFKLSQAAIETLSIIAYKQPITRLDIDDIRGVNSSGMLQKLEGRQLIEQQGRLDAPGRPILYGTTDYFMDYFGLATMEDLPELEEENLEEVQVVSLFDYFDINAEDLEEDIE